MRKIQGQEKQIEVLIRARYPILYIVSWEEQRVVDMICRIGDRANKEVYEWSCTNGLVKSGSPSGTSKSRNSSSKDPIVALNEVIDFVQPSIFIFKDFHAWFTPQTIRLLKDISQCLKSSYKTLMLVSPFLDLPPDLEKDVNVIDHRLPTLEELSSLLMHIGEEIKDNPRIKIDLDSAGREEILKAALGLTLSEAENVFAKVLVSKGSLAREDVASVFAEKRQIIRKSGLLDYYEPQVDINDIGGLNVLKTWLARRKLAFADRAKSFGLPPPRGVLLLGVQGCGKSLSAKAVSSLWHLPLLRFDVGRMFSSLVGSSEENVRRAINIAESIAPCVMWVDEIDKAFGAMSGSATDSGTSHRVLGTFLTWLAEKTSSVFVVATANKIQLLPPELLRKGRFDEIFFVDLPNAEERKDIFSIHLTKRERDIKSYDLDDFASRSSGMSGAEIEQVIISALFEAFHQNRDLEGKDIQNEILQTVPLSRTMEEEIKSLREWASTRARNASDDVERSRRNEGRKLEI